VPSLTLALRALWFRRGVSIAVLLVATITTAAAAAGALYQRAGGESVLRDGLTAAPVSSTGLDVSYADLPQNDPLGTLQHALAAAGPPFAHTRRILSLQNSLGLVGAAGPIRTRLMWREGSCEHLRITAGRCPTGPQDALISTRMMRSTGFRIGQQLTGCPGAVIRFGACSEPGGLLTVRVVGTYALPEADPYWFDGSYFDAHSGNGDLPDTVDTTFISHAGADDIPATANVTAEAQYLLDPSLVRLDDEKRLRVQVTRFVSRLEAGPEGTSAVTQLKPVLDRADSDRRDLGRSVLAITLQLVALAFVVLRLVVADASEARGNEVALAKLRGYRAGSTLLIGLLEPLVLLVLALPLGLLAADVGVRLLGAAVLAPDTPVVIRTPSLLAAAGALAGGIFAAAYAGRRVLTRPVLEQWRRTGDVQPGKGGLVVETLVGLGAVVGLVGLLSRGALDEGSRSPLALLVPLLLVLVVALLGVRLLPAVCRVLVRRTRASSRLGPFLAVRTVARRPAGLRLAALLAVAVGLATFAVDGSLVAAGNRAERASTDVGASKVLVVRTEGTADLRKVVRGVDPDGTWAMAAELWLPFGGFNGTVLAVDSGALPHVAHWRSDFAPLPLPQLAAALGSPAPSRLLLTGDAVGIDLTPVTMPTPTHDVQALVTGARGQVSLPLGALRAGTHRYQALLPACGAGGCTLDGIVVPRGGEPGADVKGALRISRVADRRGGAWHALRLDLAEVGGWHQQLVSSPATSTVTPLPSGVTWRFSVAGGDAPALLRSALPWPLRIAAGRDAVLDPAAPALANFDGQSVPVDVATTVAVVPQQGREASLVDLDFVRLAVPRFEEFVTQQVWLSKSAPPDAVERLRAAGLQIVDTSTTSARRALLDRSAPALGMLLFAFAAAAAAVLAAGATAVALYLSGRRRAFELAAMLVVGAQRRSLVAAAVGEQLLVLGTALVLGVTGGLAAALLVLPSVPEVPDPGAPALRYAPHVGGLTLFLLALAAVVVATAVGAAAGLIRQARPSLLREGAP
jgi:putative ABC transport system permease protein